MAYTNRCPGFSLLADEFSFSINTNLPLLPRGELHLALSNQQIPSDNVRLLQEKSLKICTKWLQNSIV